MPSLENVSQFGRQIRLSDLTSALRFLESQTSTFHSSRIKTMMLERDQVKPALAYSNNGAFFVMTKLPSHNLGCIEDNRSQPNRKEDLMTRQVFHEFEKLLPPNNLINPPSAESSTGASPNKVEVLASVVQKEPQVASRMQAIGNPEYNTHRLDFLIPNGYCPCVTKTEYEFVMRNFDRIEKARAKETYKNWVLAIETNNDVDPNHNSSLLEPVPNEQHTYCQVCNESYENYLDHVYISLTHKKRAKIQKGPFSEIDLIIDELNTKQKWVHAWKPEKPIQVEFDDLPKVVPTFKKKPPTPYRLKPLATVKNLL